jgi:hypothetical protein
MRPPTLAAAGKARRMDVYTTAAVNQPGAWDPAGLCGAKALAAGARRTRERRCSSLTGDI